MTVQTRSKTPLKGKIEISISNNYSNSNNNTNNNKDCDDHIKSNVNNKSLKNISNNQIPGNGWSNNVKIKADRNGICLCTVNELPPWHFQHRGIFNGYRYCRDFKSAIISLLYWHNETINIWLHYIAGFYMCINFFYRIEYNSLFTGISIDNNGNSYTIPLIDRIALVISYFIGNAMPIFASAICHNFYCLNQNTHKYCWFFDFWGILTGMLIAGGGNIYFSFYCKMNIALPMLSILLILYFIAWYWCWNKFEIRMNKEVLIPKDRFPEFSFSLSSFVSFSSFIPLLLTYWLQEEYLINNDYKSILYGCTFAPILLSCGVTFFAQGNFPERFTKKLGLKDNIFDFAGHSHQLWHICTAIVMIELANKIILHYELRTSSMNECL